MRIRDVMTRDVATCRPEATLGTVASLMWERDCGAIPVVDERGAPKGIITDRDICMAVATRGRRPDEIQVKDVISGDVATCPAHEGIDEALEVMARERVRRLPIVDEDGHIAGMLSMSDLIRAADPSSKKKDALKPDAVVGALQAIVKPWAAKKQPAARASGTAR